MKIMEPITKQEKIEAALNNEAITAIVNMRLVNTGIPCDDKMSSGELAVYRQRMKENVHKIAMSSVRLESRLRS